MSEKFLVLERSILQDLEAIQQLFSELPAEAVGADASEEELIVLGYRLHNLYNAFENIFLNIARTFENTLEDRAGWHAQLLRRMGLDLSPVRPPVIDAGAHEKLDELRRFRHLFRAAYGLRLDARRLALVQEKALELREIYRRQIEAFVAFVRGLQ